MRISDEAAKVTLFFDPDLWSVVISLKSFLYWIKPVPKSMKPKL